jgi:mannitol-1-phosphate/altronate dehydrogenase
MSHTYLKEQTTYKRISAIVENLITNNSVYQERLDQQQMIERMYELFTQPNLGDDVDTIADDDLSQRINQILVVHALSGLLDDFTPEEMAIFVNGISTRYQHYYSNYKA